MTKEKNAEKKPEKKSVTTFSMKKSNLQHYALNWNYNF